jgi:hypothetical protein
MVKLHQDSVPGSKTCVRSGIRLKDRAMAQEVSRRPLTSEARVLVRVSTSGICGVQNGTGTGWSQSSLVSSVSIIALWLSTHV